MLIATGVMALSKKVSEEKAKKTEARQGKLNVGDSDVAKRAFASQSSRMIGNGDSVISRAGTEIKFEDPSDVTANDGDTDSPSIYSPNPDIQDTRRTSQLNVSSPVLSEKGHLNSGSPYSETPTSAGGLTPRSPNMDSSSQPPPYSSRPVSMASAVSPSTSSRDVNSSSASNWDTKSMSSRSTNSRGTHAIRVKTVGTDLKSGFPYHPALFDMRVHPEQWTEFTSQIVRSTKFTMNDHAQVWATATATAMTGALATSVYVGNSMKRSVQEKKVKSALQDMSDGGLGDTLKQWNDDYFSKVGLFVHLELSESAMKNPNQKSKAFRKPGMFYSKGEERDKKKDERKYVIVVTKLDEDGQPTEAIQELNGSEVTPVEIGSSGDPSMSVSELPGDEGHAAVELPADEGRTPVELPAEDSKVDEKKMETPEIYVEKDSDNTLLLEKLQLENTGVGRPNLPEKD